MVAGHPVEIRYDHVAGVLFHGTDQKMGCFRRNPVVAVDELDIDATGQHESAVSGIGNTGIFFMNDMNTGITAAIIVTDGAGTIIASVIG